MKELASLDEAFLYAVELISGTAEFDSNIVFTGEAYNYAIQVKGNTWSKFIDIRHAKYINVLQDTYNDLIAYIFDKKEAIEPQIRLCIEDGCSNIIHDVKDFLCAMVSNMTDKQKFICAIATIAAVAGYFAYDSYCKNDANVKIEISKNEVESKRLEVFSKMHESSLNANVQISLAERPIRALIGMMDDDDSISINNEIVFISKENIRNSLQVIKRSSSKVACCDGDYLLQKIDYSLGEIILYISGNGMQIKAYTSLLDDEGKEKLFEEINDKRNSGVFPFLISIQLNVEYTDKRIKHGAVVGIGAPRQDKEQKKLSELVNR